MASELVILFLLKTKYRRKLTLAVWILIFMLNLTCEVFTKGASRCQDVQCVHGTCVNGTCVCETGWQGDLCEFCGGRVRLNSPTGFITDGPGNYSVDLQCTWLIYSSQPNATIRLKFNHFATECCWDHLYVFDGDSIYAPLLAAYSGLMQPDSPTPAYVPELVTSSGTAYIHFYSDAAYNMSGFNISYSVELCPSNCSGNGVCIDGSCTCDGFWQGNDCSIPICPNDCSSHGSCNREARRCECHPDYAGEDCSSLRKTGYWETLRTNSDALYGRASHATVVYKDEMWIFGGERFRKEKYCDIWRFNFSSQEWIQPEPARVHGRVPFRRYGHTAVVHERHAYIYGGMVYDKNVTNELWRYTFDTNTWTLLSSDNAIPSLGHTAAKVEGEMIIIFGHSPIYGYLNYVQHYDIVGEKWKLVETKGSQVKGGFGHSSVYDPHSKKIYVHGGYHSESSSSYDFDDVLYVYDPASHHWEERRRGLSKRYLHSAVIISGVMLVYGGNIHNDTSTNHGSKCQSSHFLAYDITCDMWYELQSPTGHSDKFARYGHSSVVHNDSLYIFAGFNGEMLNSIIKFTSGSCEGLSDDICMKHGPGIKCVWNKDTNMCLSMSSAISTVKRYQACAAFAGSPSRDCNNYNTCSSCVLANADCIWCNGICAYKICPTKGISEDKDCHQNQMAPVCGNLHSCQACVNEPGCSWNSDSRCQVAPSDKQGNRSATCQPPCSQHTSCHNCTQGQCLWCSSGQGRCVESNAYAPAFSYGQCMDWTTRSGRCPPLKCSNINTCEKCLDRVECGWCDDGTKTGLGVCMEGGNQHAVKFSDGDAYPVNDMCKGLWNFTSCPACQCNGHSNCTLLVDECDQPCHDNTVGNHCEHCAEGYYGNPVNGGLCTPCFCNGHGTLCVPDTGKCYCTTKGIIGTNCDRCDESNVYYGNPTDGGTCFYKLTIDFQFTFNLSKPEDMYFTQINFMSTPPKPDMDTDFTMSCNVDASINVTFKTATKPEQILIYNQSCENVKRRFSHSDYSFGSDENTTFFVYVYDFQTPMWIQIAFSQYPKLDLLQFFITFSSCFLILLIVAAVLWKIKQKYDLYRRRQRLFVEMEQMASRPFASVFLELEHRDGSGNVPQEVQNCNPPNKKKRKDRPSPIALEPCYGNKAAVLSLIVRLPTGDEDYTPPGQSGIAIASTLVTLGNPRKPSVDTQKSEGKGKVRKSFQQQHPDACI